MAAGGVNEGAARYLTGAHVAIACTAIAWTCLGAAEAGDLFLLKIVFLVAGFTAAVVSLVALAIERTALALAALVLALPACAVVVWWIRSTTPVEL